LKLRARMETHFKQPPNSDGALIAKEILASLPGWP
jgi:hypothetical protein